jgi:hypothetical protein
LLKEHVFKFIAYTKLLNVGKYTKISESVPLLNLNMWRIRIIRNEILKSDMFRKLFYNKYLSESSFTYPGLRANMQASKQLMNENNF